MTFIRFIYIFGKEISPFRRHRRLVQMFSWKYRKYIDNWPNIPSMDVSMRIHFSVCPCKSNDDLKSFFWFFFFSFLDPKRQSYWWKREVMLTYRPWGKVTIKILKVYTHMHAHTRIIISISLQQYSLVSISIFTLWKYLGKPSFITVFVVPNKNASGITLYFQP